MRSASWQSRRASPAAPASTARRSARSPRSSARGRRTRAGRAGARRWARRPARPRGRDAPRRASSRSCQAVPGRTRGDRARHARDDRRRAQVDEHVELIAQDHGVAARAGRARGATATAASSASRSSTPTRSARPAAAAAPTAAASGSCGSAPRARPSRRWPGRRATQRGDQPPARGRRVFGCSTPAPPAISATPLAYTSSRWAGR